MVDQSEKMVLRTVYLPPDLDEKLRLEAFWSKTTKNDVIREAVAEWFASRASAAKRCSSPFSADRRDTVRR